MILHTERQLQYLVEFRAALRLKYNEFLAGLNQLKYGFPYAPGQEPRPVAAFGTIDVGPKSEYPEAKETVLSVMVDIFKLQESIDMLRNETTLATNMSQNFHQYLRRIESMGRENNIPFSVRAYDQLIG